MKSLLLKTVSPIASLALLASLSLGNSLIAGEAEPELETGAKAEVATPVKKESAPAPAKEEAPAAATPAVAPAATPAATPSAKAVDGTMANADIDNFLNGLFERHRKIKRVEAKLEQTKTGGPFKMPVKKAGTLKLEMPNHMLLDMTADGEIDLVDGKYAWIQYMDPDLGNNTERYLIKGIVKEGESLDLASFMLGAEVKTAAELRRDFDISGVRAAKELSLALKPHGDKAKAFTLIELKIQDDGVLPHWIKTTGTPAGSAAPPVTTRIMTGIRTDLDGLGAFPAGTFEYKVDKDTEVVDKSAEGGDKKISYEDLIKEQESRKQAGAAK